SDVQRGADGVRGVVSEELLDRIGPSGRLRGRFGTVTRVTRERRQLRDEDEVFDALDDHDVPREWVTGVDTEKLDVVLAVTDLDEAAVYDVETTSYVQKTGVSDVEKREYLAGLRERLDGVGGEAAAELREDIDDLERQIDDVLAGE
ncbi:MAG: hypothetical protein ABEH83_02645, partial [Halobacterium sp.]